MLHDSLWWSYFHSLYTFYHSFSTIVCTSIPKVPFNRLSNRTQRNQVTVPWKDGIKLFLIKCLDMTRFQVAQRNAEISKVRNDPAGAQHVLSAWWRALRARPHGWRQLHREGWYDHLAGLKKHKNTPPPRMSDLSASGADFCTHFARSGGVCANVECMVKYR